MRSYFSWNVFILAYFCKVYIQRFFQIYVQKLFKIQTLWWKRKHAVFYLIWNTTQTLKKKKQINIYFILSESKKISLQIVEKLLDTGYTGHTYIFGLDYRDASLLPLYFVVLGISISQSDINNTYKFVVEKV